MSLSYRRAISASGTSGKKIDSAGTEALIDHEADSNAIKIALQNGLSLEGHKARQFTSSLGRQ